jgi:triosephosphate isomerase
MQADIVLAGMPDYSIGTRRVAYRQQIDAMTKRIDEMAAQTTAARKNERVFAKYSRE